MIAIAIILGLLYCIKNFNVDDPPSLDYISPLITLCIMLLKPYNMWLILILEAIADYNMGSDIRYSILVFSCGHMLKQVLLSNSIILAGISLYIIFVIAVMNHHGTNRICMGLYTLIMILTLISQSSRGFIVFIISDLMILYDDIIRFKTRQIRILLVPITYWLSQYYL